MKTLKSLCYIEIIYWYVEFDQKIHSYSALLATELFGRMTMLTYKNRNLKLYGVIHFLIIYQHPNDNMGHHIQYYETSLIHEISFVSSRKPIAEQQKNYPVAASMIVCVPMWPPVLGGSCP